MKAESRRQKKMASLLLEALGPLLIDELREATPGLVTVTRIEVPADLRTARVLLSVYGAEAAPVLEHLGRRAGALRFRLASIVEMKYNPELFFGLDPSAGDIERIDRILAETQRHDDGEPG